LVKNNPPRSAILHIGTEKTGTKSIQLALTRRRKELAELGFWYPRALGDTNHSELAIYAAPENCSDLREPGQFDEIQCVRSLAEEMASIPPHVRVVIFSNEHCHSRLITTEHVRKLRSLLAPYFETITVILYLRRQDDMAVSCFSTRLRCGHSDFDILPGIPRMRQSDPDRSQANLEDAFSYYFDYERLLDRYASVFGDQFVKPRIYEPSSLEAGNVTSDFLTTCGLPPSLSDGLEVTHRAIPADGQRFIVALNGYLADPNCALDRRSSKSLHENCLAILEARLSGSPVLPTRDEARSFYAQFTAINEQVRIKWFPERTTLFSETFHQYPESVQAHEGSPHESVIRASVIIIEDLLRRIERFDTSKSWRFTAPMRALLLATHRFPAATFFARLRDKLRQRRTMQTSYNKGT
jgi:hypothetical protein